MRSDTSIDILVVDDSEESARGFVEKIQKGMTKAGIETSIGTLFGDDLAREIGILQTRQIACREQSQGPDESLFDDADLVFIDYDLIGPDLKEAIINGDELTYLLVLFSNCGPTVSINRKLPSTFNLSLVRSPIDLSDVILSDDELDNLGLWRETTEEYRPWHWPILPMLVANDSRRTDFIRSHLHKSVIEAFKIPPLVSKIFPQTLLDHVEDINLTLSDIAKAKCRRKDAEFLSDDLLARVGARFFSIWLGQVVLMTQTVLVDLPHMIELYPSVVGGEDVSLERLRAIDLMSPGSEELPLNYLDDYRFSGEFFLGRCAWWTDLLEHDERLLEVSNPLKAVKLPFVFAEDASSFYTEDECRAFRVPGVSSFSRRWIKYFTGMVDYVPKTRLLPPSN